MSSAPTTVGFALTVPETWFELEVRPARRDAAIRELVERRIGDQPQLWEHRGELIKVLRRQARDAWESGAVYCACFVVVLDDSIIPGSMTVSIIPAPPDGAGVDTVSELLPAREARHDGDTWRNRSVVSIDGIGRVARGQGVDDVELPGGGWLRTILMQTFVPISEGRLLLVGGASPALDLVEPLLELFDAVTSTLVVFDDERGPGIE